VFTFNQTMATLYNLPLEMQLMILDACAPEDKCALAKVLHLDYDIKDRAKDLLTLPFAIVDISTKGTYRGDRLRCEYFYRSSDETGRSYVQDYSTEVGHRSLSTYQHIFNRYEGCGSPFRRRLWEQTTYTRDGVIERITSNYQFEPLDDSDGSSDFSSEYEEDDIWSGDEEQEEFS